MLDASPDEPNDLLELAAAAHELAGELDAHIEVEHSGSKTDLATAVAALDELVASVARLRAKLTG